MTTIILIAAAVAFVCWNTVEDNKLARGLGLAALLLAAAAYSSAQADYDERLFHELAQEDGR